MIVDTIANAKQYKGIHKGIDQVLEAVTAYTSDNYTVGRVALDGEHVYMNLEAFQTHKKEDGKAEAHRNHIDIMYLVEGRETIYVKNTQRLKQVIEAYDADRDILVAQIDEDVIPVILQAGDFAIFFPQDAHAPGCASGEIGTVKKIVGKVCIAD